MTHDSTRRSLLVTFGAASVGIAGCLQSDDGVSPVIGGDDSEEDDDGPEGDSPDEDNGTDDGAGSEDGDEPDPDHDELRWPAVDVGELLSDFDESERLEPLVGRMEGSEDDARIGSQALVVENDGDRAAVGIFFPDGLDLRGWDVSLAIKAETINRIGMEFHAPTFGDHLTSLRRLTNDHDDWLRVDFGYDEKTGDPDLSNVTEIRIVGFSPDDGPTRFVVDDLRRTEAVENGVAILACYGGHRSHFEIAAPLLAERDWPGAIAMDPRRIGGSNRMGVDELRQLQERGWDICSSPRGSDGLSGLPEDEQRAILETARDALANRGFDAGARHFFAPAWREMDPTNHELVRELHDTGFVFGSGTAGAPPTAMHMIPMNWGPALRGGIRRYINLADQYQLLVVIRIPRIIEDEDDVGSNDMSLGDFEHLLDHLEHRGLDVITPSDLVDGISLNGGSADDAHDRPEGTIVETGKSYTLEGSGPGLSQSFELDDGFLLASFSSDTIGRFSIDVTSSDHDLANSSLTDTSGSTTGTSIMAVEEGEYELDVQADGDWTIEIEQPRVHSDDLEDPPIEASGDGSSVVGPLWTDGDGRLTATHDGTGEFTIDLYGADGAWEQIVSHTGAFDNARSFRGVGTGWINVEADGEWSVEVR